MAGPYYKNGKQYVESPMLHLDSGNKQRGTKLQNFFDANGIDFDFRSGTGADRNNIYFVRRDEKRRPEGFFGLYDQTDYNLENLAIYNEYNRRAWENNRMALLHEGVIGSDMYIFREGEKFPRIIYFDHDGEVKMSDTIDRLNTGKLKPSRPNIFKRILHAVNDDWFKDDFDKYDERMKDYNRFTEEFNDTKTKASEAFKKMEKLCRDEASQISNLCTEEKMAEVLSSRIDEMLGPDAAGIPEDLCQKRVFQKGEYVPDKLEFPRDTGFTDHEIGVIAYAALIDPEVSAAAMNNPKLTPEDNSIRNFVHVSQDIFFAGEERDGSGHYYKGALNPARKKACDALTAYKKNNKEPLAKLLGSSIKMLITFQNQNTLFSSQWNATADSMNTIFSLINKDPELADKSGLTPEDMKEFKARLSISEIWKKHDEAVVKLQKAARGDITINYGEKKELLNDLFTGEIVKKIEDDNAADFEKTDAEYKNAVDAINTLGAESHMAKVNAKNMQAGPEKEAAMLEAKDKEYEFDKALYMLEKRHGERPVSDVKKLLMLDDDNHSQLNGLKNKIAESDTFRKYLRAPITTMREALVSDDIRSSDRIRLFTEIAKAPEEKEKAAGPDQPSVEKVKEQEKAPEENVAGKTGPDNFVAAP